jgi:hypothetical protein
LTRDRATATDGNRRDVRCPTTLVGELDARIDDPAPAGNAGRTHRSALSSAVPDPIRITATTPGARSTARSPPSSRSTTRQPGLRSVTTARCSRSTTASAAGLRSIPPPPRPACARSHRLRGRLALDPTASAAGLRSIPPPPRPACARSPPRRTRTRSPRRRSRSITASAGEHARVVLSDPRRKVRSPPIHRVP